MSATATEGIWISRPDGTGGREVQLPRYSDSHRQWLDFAAVAAVALPLAFGFSESLWATANRTADAYEQTWHAPTEPREENNDA